MNTYSAAALVSLLKPHGRTFCHEDALFFNWTCSGFTVTFTGKKLRAEIRAFGDRLPMPPDAPVDYPCIGLVGEDGETLVYRKKCAEGTAWYSLFEGEQGTHTVRLIKLSENMRGKTALLSLATDGTLLPAQPPEKAWSIELIGDSITCGFGSEASGRDSLFETSEENGWLTYGAVAARKLHAEFSLISVSGISVSRAKRQAFPLKAMDEVYEYRDIYCDEMLGRVPERWDFRQHKPDLIIVNLGTNDVGPIRFYTSLTAADEEEIWFAQKYRTFLEKLRALNGKEPFILCTLGPLDYYLYNIIEKTVAAYRGETGDCQIFCRKLIGVNLMTEGFGAVSHPSIKTQLRMGNELAARVEQLNLGNKIKKGPPLFD